MVVVVSMLVELRVMKVKVVERKWVVDVKDRMT